jgi:hypothetical protein
LKGTHGSNGVVCGLDRDQHAGVSKGGKRLKVLDNFGAERLGPMKCCRGVIWDVVILLGDEARWLDRARSSAAFRHPLLFVYRAT